MKSLAAFTLILLLASVVPAPSAAPDSASLAPGKAMGVSGQGQRGAPDYGKPPSPDGGAPLPAVAPAARVPDVSVPAIQSGLIAWAEPDHGGDYLATRFPVGTLVRLCSHNGCIVRRTNDFGPKGPTKIADLAVLDWEQITGLPRERGVAPGTIEVIRHIELPATDMEGG